MAAGTILLVHYRSTEQQFGTRSSTKVVQREDNNVGVEIAECAPAGFSFLMVAIDTDDEEPSSASSIVSKSNNKRRRILPYKTASLADEKECYNEY